jgi:hypothetical protein
MMTPPRWSTASLGDAPDSSPMELSALKDHVHVCHGLSGRLFAMSCRAEAVHGFVAGRFLTTLVAALAAFAALVWAL